MAPWLRSPKVRPAAPPRRRRRGPGSSSLARVGPCTPGRPGMLRSRSGCPTAAWSSSLRSRACRHERRSAHAAPLLTYCWLTAHGRG
eukprot:6590110-Prymnesium_polylepis.1